MGGSVAYQDGEKLSSGTVYFENDKISGFGIIQEDGTYTMGLTKPGEGIPPGEYTVYLGSPMHTTSTINNPKSGIPSLAMIPLVDPKYTSSTTSDMKITVSPSKKTYDISVPRNPNLPK